MTSDEPSPDTVPSKGRFDRRALLRGAGATGAAATIATFWFEGFGNPLRRAWVKPTPAAPGRTFDPTEWRTLEAALDRLVPSAPGSPGAKDVNAIGYLDAVLQESGMELEPVWTAEVKAGAARLHASATAAGAVDVTTFAGAWLDARLKECEADGPGQNFLRRMIYFALEALLGDPVHGGNTNGSGWKWLGIEVGGPRPPAHGWKPRQR